MRGKRGLVCALSAIVCGPALCLATACVSEAGPVGDGGVAPSDAASDALVDGAADGGAEASVPCDASPPSSAAFSVGCGDAGPCDSHTSACCFALPSKCEPTSTCTSGFFCDKSADCATGICCASIGTPNRATCPTSASTSSGSTCSASGVCGLGQVELCAKGETCKDSSKTCTSVDVEVNLNDFDLGHHLVGACL